MCSGTLYRLRVDRVFSAVRKLLSQTAVSVLSPM